MDWFEIPPRECGGAARESRRGARLEWEFQCDDSASHAWQLQLGVRCLFSDTRANRNLLLVLKPYDSTPLAGPAYFRLKMNRGHNRGSDNRRTRGRVR